MAESPTCTRRIPCGADCADPGRCARERRRACEGKRSCCLSATAQPSPSIGCHRCNAAACRRCTCNRIDSSRRAVRPTAPLAFHPSSISLRGSGCSYSGRRRGSEDKGTRHRADSMHWSARPASLAVDNPSLRTRMYTHVICFTPTRTRSLGCRIFVISVVCCRSLSSFTPCIGCMQALAAAALAASKADAATAIAATAKVENAVRTESARNTPCSSTTATPHQRSSAVTPSR